MYEINDVSCQDFQKHPTIGKSITQIDLDQSIRTVIEDARKYAAKAVNTVMVNAYWEIGRLIVENEQEGKARAAFGENVLENLSQQLTKEFRNGFDISNLRNIRKFYLVFPKRDALRHELSWTHYRSLMRPENMLARQFYLKETIDSQWSTRQLNRQINAFYYERLCANRNKAKVNQRATHNRQQTTNHSTPASLNINKKAN